MPGYIKDEINFHGFIGRNVMRNGENIDIVLGRNALEERKLVYNNQVMLLPEYQTKEGIIYE